MMQTVNVACDAPHLLHGMHQSPHSLLVPLLAVADNMTPQVMAGAHL
jgi:hypothetical protein